MLPGSFTENCTFALPSFTVTCGASPTGQINLQFTQNDAVTDQVVSAEEKTLGPVTIKTRTSSDTSTAGVTGSVLGNPASGGSATVGVNHNSTVEFLRLPFSQYSSSASLRVRSTTTRPRDLCSKMSPANNRAIAVIFQDTKNDGLWTNISEC